MQIEEEENQKKQTSADLAFVLGIIGLIAWIIPLIGLPISIFAIVKGNEASSFPKGKSGTTMGILGVVLSAISMLIGLLFGI